jgi:hypothetical protein
LLIKADERIRDWRDTNVLIATKAGQIIFATDLQVTSSIFKGEKLLYIQPVQTEYYGRLTLTPDNARKLKIGQRIILKLDQNAGLNAVFPILSENGLQKIILRSIMHNLLLISLYTVP